MKTLPFSSLTVLLLFSAMLFSSCETDSYEKGEGSYSLLQADFAELTVDGQRKGVSFITDEGDQYTLSSFYTASWIQKADTTYRTIIYYNKVEASVAEVHSMGQMATLLPVDVSEFESQPQDPVGLESVWLTRNGKYINVGLLLKNGRIDDEEGAHAVAIACDDITTNDDQTRTAHYRLLHSQGGTPEYYTNRRYLSILLPSDRPDSAYLTINTYDGVVVRRFAL